METPHRTLRNLYLDEVHQCSTPLKIPASPFMKTLGYGTGVNVYKLERSPKGDAKRSPWAVKIVSRRTREAGGELFNARIQEEAAILRQLSHPNIVGYRGVAKHGDGNDALALECCKTSLGDILEERRDEELGPLPAAETLKMIADIARALDYLHTEAKILHGDLKSYNVLVKGDFEICKLCDFGVSLPLDEHGLIDFQKNPTLKYVGTNSWCAPEIMDESDVIDSKADIFSFGLIIYETIALVVPHSLPVGESYDESITNSSQENVSCDSSNEFLKLEMQLDKACGTRPPLPESFNLSEDYDRVVEYFYCCTNELPEDRLSAKVIWQSLDQNEEPKELKSPEHKEESK